MVEDIESLPAELQLRALGDAEIIGKRSVELNEAGSFENAQWGAAECIERRPLECRGVEPCRRTGIRNMGVADQIRARTVAVAEIGVTAADSEWGARSRRLEQHK